MKGIINIVGIIFVIFGISLLYYNPLNMNLLVSPLISFIGGIMFIDGGSKQNELKEATE